MTRAIRSTPRARPEAASETPGSIFPSLPALFDPREPFLIPLLMLLVARTFVWIGIPFASEDAYITFRFARNLAAGNGLVYNPGEHVFGFSSPLWTLWNALAFKAGMAPVDWAKLWSVAADVVTLLVMANLLRRHVSRTAAWCFAFFFAVWPYNAAVTASGMEMNVMLALIVLGAALAERRRLAAGPVLGALALTRPEGVAAAALIALGAGWRDRAVAAAIVAAGVAALWSVFGSPIPQSVIAKSQIYGTPGPWTGRHWWEWLTPALLGSGAPLSDTIYLAFLRILLFPAVVVGAPILWRKRSTALGLATFAMLLVWVGYSLLGVTYFFWYLLIPLTGIVALASVGYERIVKSRWVTISVAVYCVTSWTVLANFYRGRAAAEYSSFGETANFLLRSAVPGETVMLEPIGIIGFETPLRVVDEVGLVSPQVVRRRRAGSGWYTDLATSEHPEWLVVRYGVLRSGTAFAGKGAPFRSPVERDSLFARYQHVFTAQKDAGDNAVMVFRKR